MHYGNHLRGRLTDIGFVHQGGPNYLRGDLLLDLGQTWATFRLLAASEALGDPLRGQMGVAGPWKPLGSGEEFHMVADIHRQALEIDADGDDADDQQRLPLAGVIEWLARAAVGAPFDDWQPPDRAEIESYYGPQKLTVTAGAYVRQGRLELGPRRLAVRMPIATGIPADLPAPRRAWLKTVMLETQDRFRMVRIGFTEQDEQQSGAPADIWAEIDLSGAPHAVLEALFTSGLAALQNAVQWSIQSVGFLVDASLDGRALEVRTGRLELSSRKG